MAPTGSAQYMVSMMFETGSSNNYGHYSNATVDELSEKLKATFDETERTDIAKQILCRASERYGPLISLQISS